MTMKEMEKTEKLLGERFKLSLFSVASRRRKRKHFSFFSFLILLIVGSMILYLATYFQIQRHHPHQQKQQLLQSQTISGFENGIGIFSENNNFVAQAVAKTGEDEKKSLGQISCLLPKLDPFDESIIEFIKLPQNIDCNSDDSYPHFFETDFQNTLIQTTTFLSHVKENPYKIECCYQTFHRENPTSLSDKGTIRFSDECFPITSPRQKIPQEHEFIYIQCKNGTNQGNPTDKEEERKQNYKDNNNDNDTKTTEKKNNERDVQVFFRDMFAFVPLKSHVEQRITQYQKYREVRNQYQNKYSLENRRQKNRGKRKGSNEFSSQEIKDDYDNNNNGNDDDNNRLNVLLLGLDAQSHMNFLRQMPLTAAYLVKNLSAIGLSGYTKVGENTFPNIVPLLTGLNTSELRDYCWNIDDPYFDDCPFIFKLFSKHGYRTSFAEDSIWMSIFTYNKPGFSSPPTDYYLHPFMDLMAKTVGHEMLGNSELCYGNRLGFKILLDYIIKTAITFQGIRGQRKDHDNDKNVDKKYFQFVFVSSLFHDFLNLPKLGDELLANTIKYLHRQNYLNNTLLLLHSDHGIRFGPIRTTRQGKIEENMPLAYFVLPPWFHKKYPHLVNNLQINSKRLTTPFDIHQTLLDIVNLKSLSNKKEKTKNFKTEKSEWKKFNLHHKPKSKSKPKRSISLFDSIPMSRTCEHAEIEAQFCVCNYYENTVQISTETQLVKMAAEFVVQKINEFLFDLQEEEYCAKLKLFKILGALKLTRTKPESPNEDIFSNVHSLSSIQSTARKKRGKQKISIRNNIKNNSSISNEVDEINKSNSDGSNEAIKSTVEEIQITLLLEPGHGKFEATIVVDKTQTFEEHELSNFTFSLSGVISRINLYGLQSSCITNTQLEKYCYCIGSKR